MNDWNQLETQLRSWTPRGPSRKLEARLFGPASSSETENAAGDERPFSWQWFAPSMAGVLMATFLLGHQSGMLAGLSSVTSPGLIATAALSQPNLSTYYVSVRHSENNTPLVGLEWTNGAFALMGASTNHLLH